MSFAAPANALWLLLVPVVMALYAYGFRRRREALRAFVHNRLAASLLPARSPRRQWLKAAMVATAAAILGVAAMKPQWGRSADDVPRRGRDIVILLDVSLSMLAADGSSSRLERAKNGIAGLVEHVRASGGQRLGLVAFAGRASMQVPLTLDYGLFLQRLSTVGPESVPRQGTAIGDAIRQSLRGFGTLDYGFTDIILISDAEDHGSLPHAAAEAVAAHGVDLYAVGVGDSAQGAPVPDPAAEGESAHIAFRGRTVQSRMDPDLVRELARIADGAFVLAESGPVDLVDLYEEEIADKPRKEIETAASDQRAHRYQWFVALALLILAAEMMVRDLRPGATSGRRRGSQ